MQQNKGKINNNTLKFKRIHIELTNHCNFSCEFCPNSIMTRKRGFMNFALLQKILDEISNYKMTNIVLFHLMGEPLLYPNLEEAIEYAHSRGINIYLTTNGYLLEENKVEVFYKAGLRNFTISLLSPDIEIFRLRGAKNILFEEYVRRILVSSRKILSYPDTTLEILFLTNPWGNLVDPTSLSPLRQIRIINHVKELRSAIELWIRNILGNDALQNKDIKKFLRKKLNWFSCWEEKTLSLGPQLRFITRLLGNWRIKNRKHNFLKSKLGYCPGLQEDFGVLWNGDVVFCCIDYDGKTVFGNLIEHSIVELHNSVVAQKVKQGFRKCYVEHPHCRICLGGKNFIDLLFYICGTIFYFKLYRKLFSNRTKSHFIPHLLRA